MVALLTMAGYALVGWLVRESRPWKRLNNGWEVRLQGLSFGRIHSYPPGNQLFQHLHRSPPGWLVNSLGFQPIKADCGDRQRDSLCFWLRLRTPPDASDNVVEMLADEAGHESAAFQHGIGMQTPDDTGIGTHGAFVWPSSRHVALRLYEHQQDGSLVPLAEYSVRNPGYARTRAAMTPEALPTARTHGDLTVVFEGFGHEPLPVRPHWHRRPTTRPLPFIRLRTLEHGQPSSGWQVRYITLSDGAANSLPFETFSFPANDQEIVPLSVTTSEDAEVPCVLWPGAKAWKVRLVMGIRPGVAWAPNEVFTLRDLAIEREEQGGFSLSTNATWNRFALGVWAISNDAQPWINWLPKANGLLEISLGEHLPDAMIAVTEARDDRGSPIVLGPALPQSWGYHGERMSTRWSIPFFLPPDAGRLTLSLGVKPNRVLEFVVPAPSFPPAKAFVVPH